MGLIDADAMMKHLENLLCGNCDTPRKEGWCDVCDYAFLMNEMKKEPTVDAVEVVRCKDCKHNSLNRIIGNAYCDLGIGIYQLDDYCSRGERKEDASKID